MKSYSEVITPGAPLKMPIGGKTLYILSSSAGPVLSIEFVAGGTAESSKIERVGKGLKATPAARFDGVKISTTVETTVEFIVTDGDVEMWFNEDAVTVGNTDAEAIPVKTPAGAPLFVKTEAGSFVEVRTNDLFPLAVNFAGTVEPVFGIATVDNTDAEAIPMRPQALTTLIHGAPVSVGVVATSLGASDATLRKLIFRNDHATAKVAIGGAGVTLANAPIVLLPGDIWEERDAAGIEWYGISDTAATDVQVMGLK